MTEKFTEKYPASRPLLATVGAGDAVYAAVIDAVNQVRERAAATDVTARVDEARERFANLPADVQAQFETLRKQLSDLPSELPEDLAELREKFTAEELRRLAEQYYRQALDLYSDLTVRGEETLERLRANHLVEERVGRVETLYKDAAERAEGVFERVNGLIGRPVKESVGAPGAPVTENPVVEGEVVGVATETEPAPAPKKAPAKKTTAKKAPAAKKTTAAKKA